MKNILRNWFPSENSLCTPAYLVVGLGNPGKNHHFSRHNSGALAARILHYGMSEKTPFQQKKRFLLATGHVGEAKVAIGLPRTPMNASGDVVAEMVRECQLQPEQVLILHDDADFEMGICQVTTRKGSGGHRGIDSVIKCLESDKFYRVRIGIGRPADHSINMITYVLEQTEGEERDRLIHSALWGAETSRFILSSNNIDNTIKTIKQRNTRKIIHSMVNEGESSSRRAVSETKLTLNWKTRLAKRRQALVSSLDVNRVNFRRRLMRAKVIAITGSFGKTATKDALETILQIHGPTHSTRGNSNLRHGVYQTLNTLKWHHRFCVVEIATVSKGMIYKATKFVKPDIAVITCVAGAHSNVFPSLDDTAKEKSMLVRHLGPRGLAILNADDARVLAMRDLTRARSVTYGFSEGADYRILEPSAQWPDRLTFKLVHLDESVQVTTQMIGIMWSHAVAAAISAAHQCGMSLADAADAVGRVEPHVGRLQPVPLPNGVDFIRDEVDPSIHSARAAFAAFAIARTKGRRIAVVSPLTDIELPHTERDRQLAKEVVACADMVVFVDHADNLKTKMATALEAGLPAERIRGFQTVREAAIFLRSDLKSGDLVLLKGRTSDHLTRILFYQTGDIACWIKECRLRNVCDRCPKLGYVPF